MIKRSELEAEFSLQSSAQIENAWSFAITLHAYLHDMKQIDKLSLYFRNILLINIRKHDDFTEMK
jgi:hypothetical protein